MKIGLIGAPGAGKSDLAEGLLGEGVLPGRRPQVIDDYVQTVEDRYDIATAYGGTYASNLAVALERLGTERRLDRDFPESGRITCGTLIETSVYEATQAFATENQPVIWRAYNVMQVFVSLFMDAWDYDLVFHLPGGADDEFTQAIEREIPFTIEKTGLEVIELSGNVLEDALKAIEEKNADVSV